MQTVRNLALGAAAAAFLGIGAAAAQEPTKPAAKPETAHRHAGPHGNRGQQGCGHGSGENHEHQSHEKDERHEHGSR